jgi:hypothetical protein
MVEAPDHHGMAPTSTPYIYKVFETIHMLRTSCEIHHATTKILVGSDLGFRLGYIYKEGDMVEAPDSL